MSLQIYDNGMARNLQAGELQSLKQSLGLGSYAMGIGLSFAGGKITPISGWNTYNLQIRQQSADNTFSVVNSQKLRIGDAGVYLFGMGVRGRNFSDKRKFILSVANNIIARGSTALPVGDTRWGITGSAMGFFAAGQEVELRLFMEGGKSAASEGVSFFFTKQG